MLFLINIDIKWDSVRDIDDCILYAVGIIKEYTMFKFRVVGEPRLLAVLNILDAKVMNTIYSSLPCGVYTVMFTMLSLLNRESPLRGGHYTDIGLSLVERRPEFFHWLKISIASYGEITAHAYSTMYVQWMNAIANKISTGNRDAYVFNMYKENWNSTVHIFMCSYDPNGTGGLHFNLPAFTYGQITQQIKMLTDI